MILNQTQKYGGNAWADMLALQPQKKKENTALRLEPQDRSFLRRDGVPFPIEIDPFNPPLKGDGRDLPYYQDPVSSAIYTERTVDGRARPNFGEPPVTRAPQLSAAAAMAGGKGKPGLRPIRHNADRHLTDRDYSSMPRFAPNDMFSQPTMPSDNMMRDRIRNRDGILPQVSQDSPQYYGYDGRPYEYDSERSGYVAGVGQSGSQMYAGEGVARFDAERQRALLGTIGYEAWQAGKPENKGGKSELFRPYGKGFSDEMMRDKIRERDNEYHSGMGSRPVGPGDLKYSVSSKTMSEATRKEMINSNYENLVKAPWEQDWKQHKLDKARRNIAEEDEDKVFQEQAVQAQIEREVARIQQEEAEAKREREAELEVQRFDEEQRQLEQAARKKVEGEFGESRKQLEAEVRELRSRLESAAGDERETDMRNQKAGKNEDIFSRIGGSIGGLLVDVLKRDPYHVEMQILLHNAKGLPATDAKWEAHGLGRCDPYVSVSIVKGNPLARGAHFTYQTPQSYSDTIYHTQEPNWEQMLDIDIGQHLESPWEAADMFVYVEVWDADYINDERVAHCVLPLSEVLEIRGVKYMTLRPILSSGVNSARKLKKTTKLKKNKDDDDGAGYAAGEGQSHRVYRVDDAGDGWKSPKDGDGTESPEQYPTSESSAPTSEDEGISQSGKRSQFVTNYRILRLRARFGGAELHGDVATVRVYVGHILGLSSFQLKAFMELRLVRGDPRHTVYTSRPLAAARTPSRFCENRSCEWNCYLEGSCISKKDVYVSLILYRGNEAQANNVIAAWSTSLYKLLRLAGQRAMKLEGVIEGHTGKVKFNVSTASITCSFLAAGIMEEDLPDYDNIIDVDDDAVVGNDIVKNYLDLSGFTVKELGSVDIIVGKAENLPPPYDLSFRVTSALFVELCLIQDAGGGKFLIQEPLTSELNNAIDYPTHFSWGDEVVTMRNIPLFDETLVLGVRILHFRVVDGRNHYEEVVRGELPLHYFFEMQNLKTVQSFAPIALPRQRQHEINVKQTIINAEQKKGGRPPKMNFLDTLLNTQDVELSLRLLTFEPDIIKFRISSLTGFLRDVFVERKVSMYLEIRLLKKENRYFQGYDPVHDEFLFFPSYLEKHRQILNKERKEKQEYFFSAALTYQEKVELRKDEKRRAMRPHASTLVHTKVATSGVAPDPESGEWHFNEDVALNIEKSSEMMGLSTREQLQRLEKYSCLHFVVYGHDPTTGNVFTDTLFGTSVGEEHWQPLCHFSVPFRSLQQMQGLVPVFLRESRDDQVDDDDEVEYDEEEDIDLSDEDELLAAHNQAQSAKRSPVSWRTSSPGTAESDSNNGALSVGNAADDFLSSPDSITDGTAPPSRVVRVNPVPTSQHPVPAKSSTMTSFSQSSKRVKDAKKQIRKMKLFQGRPHVYLTMHPSDYGRLGRNDALKDRGDDRPSVEPPKNVMIVANIQKVTNLPATRYQIFGSKACYPYVRAQLVRGNPLAEDDEVVELSEWKQTYVREGCNAKFGQRLLLANLATSEKKVHAILEVYDSPRFVFPELIGMASIDVHSILLNKGIRPRKVHLIPGGFRANLAEGGPETDPIKLRSTLQQQEEMKSRDTEVFVKFEKCLYEAGDGITLQVRIMRIINLVVPDDGPTDPSKEYLKCECFITYGGDPKMSTSDEEIKNYTMEYDGGKWETQHFWSKSKKYPAHANGKAHKFSKFPVLEELFNLDCDDWLAEEDLYFYLVISMTSSGYFKSEKYLLGHVSVPLVTLLTQFGHKPLKIEHAPSVDLSNAYDLSRSRIHVAFDIKKAR